MQPKNPDPLAVDPFTTWQTKEVRPGFAHQIGITRLTIRHYIVSREIRVALKDARLKQSRRILIAKFSGTKFAAVPDIFAFRLIESSEEEWDEKQRRGALLVDVGFAA